MLRTMFERSHYERLAADYWDCWGEPGRGFLLVAPEGNVFGWSSELPKASDLKAGTVAVSANNGLLAVASAPSEQQGLSLVWEAQA